MEERFSPSLKNHASNVLQVRDDLFKIIDAHIFAMPIVAGCLDAHGALEIAPCRYLNLPRSETLLLKFFPFVENTHNL
jgi:hypothetical protein